MEEGRGKEGMGGTGQESQDMGWGGEKERRKGKGGEGLHPQTPIPGAATVNRCASRLLCPPP